MVSIEDVAQRVGVSVASDSRALRGLPKVASGARQRVEAAGARRTAVARGSDHHRTANRPGHSAPCA